MSAANIAYHLRTGKFADRALFVELLRRLERWRPLDNYTYVSMGGYTMADHARVSRVLGLQRLVSFDTDARTVRRARFNSPTEATFVKEATAKEVAERIDDLLQEWGVQASEGRIVWFDFTTPSKLQEDLLSFANLVNSSVPGDILRITLNADPRNLPRAPVADDEATEEEKKRQRLAEVVEETDIGEEDPNDSAHLPRILARAIGRISTEAAGPTKRTVCLSSVTYSDGTKMVAVTLAGTDQPSANGDDPHTAAKLASWPLASRRWDQVHDLRIQTLTSREREQLERRLPNEPASSILSSMGLEKMPGLDDPAAHFDEYGQLIRFYPDFISLI